MVSEKRAREAGHGALIESAWAESERCAAGARRRCRRRRAGRGRITGRPSSSWIARATRAATGRRGASGGECRDPSRRWQPRWRTCREKESRAKRAPRVVRCHRRCVKTTGMKARPHCPGSRAGAWRFLSLARESKISEESREAAAPGGSRRRGPSPPRASR